MFYNYTETCLCLMVASTPSSTNHTNSKAVISTSEIESLPYGFICVISDNFTTGIHYCPHNMGSSSSAHTIHTPLLPSPDASMNSMYAESPGISYVHLVGSVDASCGSFLILSTDCLTAVYFSVFAHDFYLPSTEFT